MSYVLFNPNPYKKRVGDCTVRAIAKATGQTWEETYSGLCLEGFEDGDMPSANNVWGAYLRRLGFTQRIAPSTCPTCYTVRDFCREHPGGPYILALPSHVVCAVGGDYYDAWDSGDQAIVYFWERT